MDRTANYLKFIAIGIICGLTTISCNDSFMKETTRNKTSGLAALSTTIDEAGNISATIDPNATTTQVLKFSTGTLAGSAIAIPPGALAIPVSITVGEGENLSSSQFLQTLGITNNTVTAAGPSVSFIPSQTVEASNPFTLSIPISTTALALLSNGDNLIVMYRWTKVVNGEPVHSMGIIPGSDVVISDSKVSFQTTKFGVFQLARSETKIVEKVNVPTIEPPVLKKDAGNPLIGTWAMCSSETNTGGGGSDGNASKIEIVSSHSVNRYTYPGGPGGRGVAIRWRDGMTPFKIERSSVAAFSSPETLSANINDFFFEDMNLSSTAQTMFYRVTDKYGVQSSIFPVTVLSHIEITNVQTTSDGTAIISWQSNRDKFYLMEWSDSTCTGAKSGTTPTLFDKVYQATINNLTSARHFTIQDFNSTTSSACISVSPRDNQLASSLRAEFVTGTPNKIKLSWTVHTSGTIKVWKYLDQTCNPSQRIDLTNAGTFAGSTFAVPELTTLLPFTAGQSYYLGVSNTVSEVETNFPCMQVIIPSSGSAGIDLLASEEEAPLVSKTWGKVKIEWAPVTGGSPTKYIVERHESATCSNGYSETITPSDGITGTIIEYTRPWWSSQNYYKVKTINLTTNLVSPCFRINQTNIAGFGMLQLPTWEGFSASGDEINLYARFLNQPPTQINLFNGSGCTGEPAGNSTSDTQSKVIFSGLSKNSDYSFKSETGSLRCINLRTSEWQPLKIVNTATKITFTSKVTTEDENTTSYKFILINPMTSVEFESQVAFTKNDNGQTKTFEITDPDLSGLRGLYLAIRAPSNCNMMQGGKWIWEFVLTPDNTTLAANIYTVSNNANLEIFCKAPSGDGGSTGPSNDPMKTFGFIESAKYSEARNLKISGTDFIQKTMRFASGDCTGIPFSTVTEAGKFNLLQVDVADTIPLDVNSLKLGGAIGSEQGIRNANQEPDAFGCGLKDWKIGLERDLSTTACGADIGKTQYTRIKIVGSKLYMCEPENSNYGKTAATRVPHCNITETSNFLNRQ